MLGFCFFNCRFRDVQKFFSFFKSIHFTCIVVLTYKRSIILLLFLCKNIPLYGIVIRLSFFLFAFKFYFLGDLQLTKMGRKARNQLIYISRELGHGRNCFLFWFERWWHHEWLLKSLLCLGDPSIGFYHYL